MFGNEGSNARIGHPVESHNPPYPLAEQQKPTDMIEGAYEELTRMARGVLVKFKGGSRFAVNTYATGDLVNQTMCRMLRKEEQRYHDTNHFKNVAAIAMFQILKDHCKIRGRYLHGQPMEDVMKDREAGFDERLSALLNPAETQPEVSMALSAALDELQSLNHHHYTVFIMKTVLGLKHEEIATLKGLSLDKTKKSYRLAKTFLRMRIKQQA